ncbi:PfaD family polyunsaturated fatty acid/polyketide biosynthesis protein [Candidatus Woesearchaeota archaeon]|nr:PfaD family polyunsaturated fatty acid/polyketide biosynthesis protein [Candidatus Woesearchaeota archaeon]
MKEAMLHVQKPFCIVLKDGLYAAAKGGTALIGNKPQSDALPVIAYVPSFPLENLGDPEFCKDYNVHYPFYAGSMAQGISSVEMVESLANEGMLCFFGAGGLPMKVVEDAVDRLKNLGDKPYGFNLIHSPNEPKLEAGIADLFIKKGMKLIEASAFFNITLPLVRFRVHGIHSDSSSKIITPNRIIAKVSRIEVASKFFSPPPEEMLQELQNAGEITEEQVSLARKIPMAQDLTAEADSGGHTDNRPAIALIPSILALRDQMQAKYNYPQKLRVGAAGGIATPASAAAAFSMGAAFIVTGSVNQACLEAGTSDTVRELLAQAQQADFMMAPTPGMFELGAKVQVLKRGTMFGVRGSKLYELYQSCAKIEDIPDAEREMLEKSLFRATLDEIWVKTREFFMERDKEQILSAEKDPKRKMALIFRWYLGQASRWAIAEEPSRKMDYQIWCGPAMGAFNEWAKGTFIEEVKNRKVVTVSLNLLHGAAVMMRLNSLRSMGLDFIDKLNPVPQEESKIRSYLS